MREDLDKDNKENDYRDMESNSEQLNNLEVENNPAKDFLYFLVDLLKTGIVVFIIAFSLRYFAVQPFIVDGESMMPNYVNNEYLLAEKISYIIGQPERGDVVIFRYPGNPSLSYIKRIIGLPGETVTIKNNDIIVSNSEHPEGIKLKENYLGNTTLTLTSEKDFKVTIPAGQYFVLGDNREHSSDSREWGLLPRGNMIGRSWLTILPFDKFGVQKRLSYGGLSFLQSLSSSVFARH